MKWKFTAAGPATSRWQLWDGEDYLGVLLDYEGRPKLGLLTDMEFGPLPSGLSVDEAKAWFWASARLRGRRED